VISQCFVSVDVNISLVVCLFVILSENSEERFLVATCVNSPHSERGERRTPLVCEPCVKILSDRKDRTARVKMRRHDLSVNCADKARETTSCASENAAEVMFM